MAQEVELSAGGTGKIRSFWVGLGLTTVTFGIYYYCWYYLVNDELKDVGSTKEDRSLAQSNPAISVVAVLIGWLLIVPPYLSIYNYGQRIKRAQRLAGIAPDRQINPVVAFLLVMPGGLLVIPTFIHYWYVTKHQNAALRATAGLPAFGEPAVPAPNVPAETGALVSAAPSPTKAVAPTSTTPDQVGVPFFGARKHARALAGEAARLRAELDRLGALSLAEIERRREAVGAEVAAQEARLVRQREEAHAALRRDREQAHADIARSRQEALEEQAQLVDRVAELREQIVITEDEVLLQEAGVYQYRHPLSDSVAYRAELERLRDRIKTMTRKDGGAVLAATNWTVNGSVSQGRTMVRDFSKLLLRAYNAEADNLVRGLKPYKRDSAIDRLTKVTSTIEKLGQTMNIRISPDYHALRVRELEFTADYLEQLAQEKEREREERERLREERRAQQEMERERARLEKERQHYTNALEALLVAGDEEGATRLREQLADVDHAIDDVDYRAANVRAGYVYVISNIGSLGANMVKIGMTRRLEPLDRVRELGDASVPFRYDVHALFFSDDAVGIEAKMHERLADRRVNRVNQRREFFYATPAEVRAHLLELAGELLQYEELAEALEYRQSTGPDAEQLASG